VFNGAAIVWNGSATSEPVAPDQAELAPAGAPVRGVVLDEEGHVAPPGN